MVEFRRLRPELSGALAAFFLQIGEDRYFHPHPFTAEQAQALCEYQGQDVYIAAVEETGAIVGYGMLRGWDDGYDVPSLGIAIAQEGRGKGLGMLLMRYLHYLARAKGAAGVRLKVYPHNTAAIELYKKLGYRFSDDLEQNQCVGYCSL